MSTQEPTAAKPVIPEKPQPPLPDECCGGGCVPCIYDYYYDALAKWQAEVDRLTALGDTE